MPVLKGKPVSDGYAEGTAVVLNHQTRPQLEVPRYSVAPAEVGGEHKRLEETVESSARDLREAGEAGSQAASEFSQVHERLMQEIAQRVREYISDQKVNVEQAIHEVVQELAKRLGTLENPYFQEREQDVRDVGQRMLGKLAGETSLTAAALPMSPVVVAYELFPSEALDLVREGIVAIVVQHGGDTSHTAILARSLGIPAVFGILNVADQVRPGMHVLVDGVLGEVVVEPSDSEIERFHEHKRQYEQANIRAAELAEEPTVTQDGVSLTLRANVGGPQDVAGVLGQHLRGVGLFRTEFLFLDAKERPSFESQVTMYEGIADALGEEPLVIRTFDFGDDKTPRFLTAERNVVLNRGLRGLQFSLAERLLFETQLRAIAKASQGRNIRVLFPMVVGGDDLRRAQELLASATREFDAGFMPMGAMIETPAALFCLDSILDQADFVAIGTSDLTQYMLAVDRDAPDPEGEYTACHPSVLRAIEQVVVAARDHNRPVSVCGEDAGDPAFACLLIGLGVLELSIAPSRARRVRQAIAQLRVDEAKDVASRCLRCSAPAEVRDWLVGLLHQPDLATCV